MRRKVRRKTSNLAGLALFIAVLSLAAGCYIHYRLNQYSPALQLFAPRERLWRDQAISIAFWSAVVAITLSFFASILRRR